MAHLSASELDVWFKDAARDQLRTFSKSITITATVWTQATTSALIAGHTHTHGVSGTSTSVTTPNWNLTAAASSVFANDLDPGIGSGLVADADDVAASISNAVLSAVVAIEGAIGNVSWNAQVCHGSCHTSCHVSRGRR